MNNPTTPAQPRSKRLAQLLRQDPGNTLLLADAADAARAEGELKEAERLVDAGIKQGTDRMAWLFRCANVRLAQHRLPEARALLEQVREAGPRNPAVDHNLAYISLLEGDFMGSARMLDPWVQAADGAAAVPDAIAALWLRAKHHDDQLADAWAWIEARGATSLGSASAGVASLIAVDSLKMEAAAALAAAALRADPSQAEALVAAACVAMARQDMEHAASLLSRATARHPHQVRAWSTWGYVDVLSLRGEAARAHFGRALAIDGTDQPSLVGLGWTHILERDLDNATKAFEAVLAVNPASADAHGGLAVAAAISGSHASSAHAQRARALQPGSVPARYADAIASGDLTGTGVRGLQRIAAALFAQGARRPPGKR
ncbi:MAG: Tetratricopeptide 2 repeat protein [Ramlibacter sp.]|nr:Tetratricopeptide 2 repeat protein [Ramlibacter sp.]